MCPWLSARFESLAQPAVSSDLRKEIRVICSGTTANHGSAQGGGKGITREGNLQREERWRRKTPQKGWRGSGTRRRAEREASHHAKSPQWQKKLENTAVWLGNALENNALWVHNDKKKLKNTAVWLGNGLENNACWAHNGKEPSSLTWQWP